MNTTEGIGRRHCKDGDEVDYLSSRRSRGADERELAINHGLRGKIKTASRRRIRRQVRADLRTSQEG